MVQIKIKPTSIIDITVINSKIPEFDVYSSEYFSNRIKGTKNLEIAAYIGNIAVGYLVAYDRYKDGSIYVWMIGVVPKYRKKGILKKLMQYLITWAKENNYSKIKIKTRNSRRAMLSFLIKDSYNIIDLLNIPLQLCGDWVNKNKD